MRVNLVSNQILKSKLQGRLLGLLKRGNPALRFPNLLCGHNTVDRVQHRFAPICKLKAKHFLRPRCVDVARQRPCVSCPRLRQAVLQLGTLFRDVRHNSARDKPLAAHQNAFLAHLRGGRRGEREHESACDVTYVDNARPHDRWTVSPEEVIDKHVGAERWDARF